MKAGSGNRKGGSFERKVSKLLSLWVSHGKHIDLFWRTAMSGGRATVMRRKGTRIRQGGDIGAVAAEGHHFTNRWFVETKAYRDLKILQFLISGSGILAKFWKKARTEARNNHQEPMMILKQNNLPWLVVTHVGCGLAAPIIISPRNKCEICLFEDMTRMAYGDYPPAISKATPVGTSTLYAKPKRARRKRM